MAEKHFAIHAFRDDYLREREKTDQSIAFREIENDRVEVKLGHFQLSKCFSDGVGLKGPVYFTDWAGEVITKGFDESIECYCNFIIIVFGCGQGEGQGLIHLEFQVNGRNVENTGTIVEGEGHVIVLVMRIFRVNAFFGQVCVDQISVEKRGQFVIGKFHCCSKREIVVRRFELG